LARYLAKLANCLALFSPVRLSSPALCRLIRQTSPNNSPSHTSLSRAGMPLRTVQEISGHSILSQLQTYLAAAPEDTREALQRLKY
jgi:hypothetical protein